jgi:hypothetical protein
MTDVYSGELILASHVQDHESRIDVLEALGIAVPRTVYKPDDETINNSSTLQNDDDLVIPLVANAVYTLRLVAGYIANATAGFKCAFTAPAGTTFEIGHYLAKVGGTTNYDNTNALLAVSGFSGTGGQIALMLEATVFVSSTAGNAQWTWAQNTAHASDCTVLKGSHIQTVRIA